MLQPMLASLADAPLADPQWAYEPKYDGIRAIAEVGPHRHARLWSRLGNEKTSQFPEIAAALEAWSGRLEAPVVLDGEIVAVNAKGEPVGFQQLQGRIHLVEKRGRESFFAHAKKDSRPLFSAVAYVVFDLLRDGSSDLRARPFIERRAALERLFRSARVHERAGRGRRSVLRISDLARADGRALYARALAEGWEGLIAKHVRSVYKSGKRTPDWRKLKIVQEQEFVIGGWTEPRQTRSHFGALLLGVYAPGRPRALIYAGHTGTGFDESELARVMKLLKPLETSTCPFAGRPKTNERPHWVRPELVAQIKFTEWTADAKLRHPVYLGLRDDKRPTDVVREASRRKRGSGFKSSKVQGAADREPGTASGASQAANLIEQLTSLEAARRDGTIELPDGHRLAVSNLHKVFWPIPKLTKGDLFRYYVQVAPFILPAVADRPLVMKRFPNGVAGKPFYQHRVEGVPDGVRVEIVKVAERRPQLVGGNLQTLLYMTQLAAISQDPWFSRMGSVDFADHVALDLDPAPGLPFERVLDVARWIHEELETLGAAGVPKTSGADGLHIYLPLPPETPYAAGLLLCQIVATVVAQKHPKLATVERSVAARGRRIYVDCLQNVLGKTLATAYSARASDYAGVSTPLAWSEVDRGVKREDFNIRTVPDRLKQMGDLWARLRSAKGVDLSRVARYAKRAGKGARPGTASA